MMDVSQSPREVTREDIERTEFYRAKLMVLYKAKDLRPPLFAKIDKELAKWRGKEAALLQRREEELGRGELCGGTREHTAPAAAVRTVFPEWLKALPIDDTVRSLFIKENIDEETFVRLEESDLKELGLTLGHRMKLAKEIAKRKSA